MKLLKQYRRACTHGSVSFDYFVSRVEKKSISLTVTPDLEVIVRAPMFATDDRIDAFVQRKWMWVKKYICFFERHQYSLGKREYISGEGVVYLGKLYELHVKEGKRVGVRVNQKSIVVMTTLKLRDKLKNKRILMDWLEYERNRIFEERFVNMKEYFTEYSDVEFKVRKMKKRWGSFSKGEILLNPRLIHASIECIDYVILHELCHLVHADHGKRFYALLKSVCPDWKMTKKKLELTFTR